MKRDELVLTDLLFFSLSFVVILGILQGVLPPVLLAVLMLLLPIVLRSESFFYLYIKVLILMTSSSSVGQV